MTFQKQWWLNTHQTALSLSQMLLSFDGLGHFGSVFFLLKGKYTAQSDHGRFLIWSQLKTLNICKEGRWLWGNCTVKALSGFYETTFSKNSVTIYSKSRFKDVGRMNDLQPVTELR